MKEFTMKKNERYHIYHQGKAIYFRRSFLEATGNMKNPEYQELMDLQTKHPDFKLLTWNIAKPEKKKESYKGLTIERMDTFLKWKYRDNPAKYKAEKAELDSIRGFCKDFHKETSGGNCKKWFLDRYKDEYLNWAKKKAKKSDDVAENAAEPNENAQEPSQNETEPETTAVEAASSEK